MDVVLLAGRILFASIFFSSGIKHLKDTAMLAPYAESKGASNSELMTRVTGAMILAGSISVVLGIWADVGALLIAAFLAPTAVIMHNYWTLDDPQARAGDQAHFMKDIALLGAAICLFWLFNQGQGNVPLTITDPLFSAL